MDLTAPPASPHPKPKYEKTRQTSGHKYIAKYGQMIRALVEGPMSQLELEAFLELSHTTVSRFLHQMRKQKLVYVESWRQDTNNKYSIAVYRFSTQNRKDAPKPKHKGASKYAKKKAKIEAINAQRALMMLPPLMITTGLPRKQSLTNGKSER